MKKIFKIVTVLMLFISVFALSACDTNAPTLEITNTAPIRDKFTVDFTVFDEDEILSSLVLTITGKVDGEDYSKSEYVTITGGEYAESEEDFDLGYEEDEFMGEKETVTFTGLEAGQKYTIIFTGTYNDKTKKMETITGTTTSLGGDAENAHEISTVEDFDLIRNDPDGYFELKNNINVSGSESKTVEVDPFFTSSKKFVGTFDGNGYTISNFNQESFDQYMGLFGYIDSEGIVKNLKIDNVYVNSKRFTNVYIGVVAGRNSGTIDGVTVTNVELIVDGPDDGQQWIGGLVGYNKGTAVIKNSSLDKATFTINAPASSQIGGLVGTNEGDGSKEIATVSNSKVSNITLDVKIPVNDDNYYAEDLESELAVGGFVGDNRAVIENSSLTGTNVVNVYAIEDVIGSKDQDAVELLTRPTLIKNIKLLLGGFAGYNMGQIISCSSTTDVNAELSFVDEAFVGGFIGYSTVFSYAITCTYGAAELNTYEITSATCDLYIGDDIANDLSLIGNNFDSKGTITGGSYSYSITDGKITNTLITV